MKNREMVKWLRWWMFNTSWEDFMAFMASNGIAHASSIQEHWNAMRTSPMYWWMNLDEELQAAVVAAAIMKYSARS